MPFLLFGYLNLWKWKKMRKKSYTFLPYPGTIWIGYSLISRYYLWGSFAKILVKHNFYFSKLWIKKYFLCHPKFYPRLPTWQNKAGISTDALPQRKDEDTAVAAQAQSRTRSLSVFSPHIPVQPFLSDLLTQVASATVHQGGKWLYFTCLGLPGRKVTSPTENSREVCCQSRHYPHQARLDGRPWGSFRDLVFCLLFPPTTHSSSVS